jgi:hypothetical protein
MAAEGARHNKMRDRLTEMAIGKISERTTCKDLALVVMAVAHGATVAHNAYIELRKPNWR